MSALLQTVLGGALTIVGGILAVLLQLRRADGIARRARAEQRREEGVVVLNTKVTSIRASFDALCRATEGGQSTSQYLSAMTYLSDLRQFWEGESAGVIGDKAIVSARQQLDAAARERIPTGSGAITKQRALSVADPAACAEFSRPRASARLDGRFLEYRPARGHDPVSRSAMTEPPWVDPSLRATFGRYLQRGARANEQLQQQTHARNVDNVNQLAQLANEVLIATTPGLVNETLSHDRDASEGVGASPPVKYLSQTATWWQPPVLARYPAAALNRR